MLGQPKINTTIALLLIIVSLGSDLVDAKSVMLLPIPYIGQFLFILAWITNKALFGLTVFYFWWKKINLKSSGIGFVIEFIPILNALPGFSGAVIATIILDRVTAAIKQHPGLASAAAKLARPSTA